MAHLEYSETETVYLRQADPAVGAVIGRLGHIDREVITDPFQALIKNRKYRSDLLRAVFSAITGGDHFCSPKKEINCS